MVRETLAALRDEVQQAREALDISQNEVGRQAGVDPSILSRVLSGALTSAPAVEKLESWLATPAVRKALAAAARAAKTKAS